MRKKYGKVLPVFSNKPYLIFIICFLFLTLLWLTVLEPVFKWMYCPPEIISEISIYTEQEYLSYESGRKMHDFIDNYYDINSQKAINFYYIDNFKRDSLIYGKMCDIYIFEVNYTATNKLLLENFINNFTFRDRIGDYDLYFNFDEQSKTFYCIAVEPTKNILRYVLIDNITSQNLRAILMRQSSISWQ